MNFLKDLANQSKLVLFLLCGFLLIVWSFSVNIDWPSNLNQLDRFIYMNRFFTDFFVFAAFFILLFNGNLIARITAICFGLVFCVLYFIQSESYASIGAYLPQIALENTAHVGFLDIDNHLFSAFFWLVSFVLIMFFCFKTKKTSYKAAFAVTICLIVISVIIKNDKAWLSDETLKQRFEFYNSGQPNIERVSPIAEFISTTQSYRSYLKKEHFFAENATIITTKAAQFAKKHFNYFGVKDKKYPLLRTTKFKQPIDFLQSHLANHSEDSGNQNSLKNVIVFFSEGISTTLVQPYHDHFPNLTPNIELFSQQALKVNNYFNHTYATYRGLGGQFCSILPVGKLLDEVDYYCLAHALSDSNYDTRFMVSQDLNMTELGRIGYKAGFKHVDGQRQISELLDEPPVTENNISDRQLFSGLIKLLQNMELDSNEESQQAPFFISLYNLETHHGFRLMEDDTVYIGENGLTNEHLNTFHNFDKFFGIFWEYFKGSKYFDNTIVIFTSDHATFPSKNYAGLLKDKDFFGSPIFVDQIPLLIYYPGLNSKIELDVHSASSLSLAPTILHLAGLKETQAPFWAESLFSTKHAVFSGMGGTTDLMWFSDKNDFWTPLKNSTKDQVRTKDQDRIAKYELVEYLQSLEQTNRLWRVEQ